MSINNYLTDNVILIWDGVNIVGFAEGTFIEVEREEDGFTHYVGSLGDVCRTMNKNRMAKVTVTLMATAPVNDLLAAKAQLDEETGTEYGPIQLKDLSGNLQCDGSEAWVQKRPKIERAKESGTIQWVFMVANMNFFEGGNVI